MHAGGRVAPQELSSTGSPASVCSGITPQYKNNSPERLRCCNDCPSSGRRTDVSKAGRAGEPGGVDDRLRHWRRRETVRRVRRCCRPRVSQGHLFSRRSTVLTPTVTRPRSAPKRLGAELALTDESESRLEYPRYRLPQLQTVSQGATHGVTRGRRSGRHRPLKWFRKTDGARTHQRR